MRLDNLRGVARVLVGSLVERARDKIAAGQCFLVGHVPEVVPPLTDDAAARMVWIFTRYGVCLRCCRPVVAVSARKRA